MRRETFNQQKPTQPICLLPLTIINTTRKSAFQHFQISTNHQPTPNIDSSVYRIESNISIINQDGKLGLKISVPLSAHRCDRVVQKYEGRPIASNSPTQTNKPLDYRTSSLPNIFIESRIGLSLDENVWSMLVMMSKPVSRMTWSSAVDNPDSQANKQGNFFSRCA